MKFHAQSMENSIHFSVGAGGTDKYTYDQQSLNQLVKLYVSTYRVVLVLLSSFFF